jgi:hypothetical protein
MNRSEVSDLRAELRSPLFAAEVAARARSPQLVRASNLTDHVADILTLERPGEVVPLVSSDRAGVGGGGGQALPVSATP